MGDAAFGVDAQGFKKFQADIRRADPKAQRLLLKRIKDRVSEVIVPAAQSKASFSSRIAGSIKVSSTAKGVSVKAGGPTAPHAAAFENRGVFGKFRHPVFGQRDQKWAEQDAHPFLTPAGEEHEADLVDAAIQGVDDWVTEIGFR